MYVCGPEQDYHITTLGSMYIEIVLNDRNRDPMFGSDCHTAPFTNVPHVGTGIQANFHMWPERGHYVITLRSSL